MNEDIRQAAEQGDADAQYKLGEMYHSRKGGHEDITKAVKWYREAAAQNHPQSLRSLAWMYKRGSGVPKDYTEAVKLYWKIIDLYDAEKYYWGIEPIGLQDDANYNTVGPLHFAAKDACYDLINLYKQGLGCQKNERTATLLSQKLSTIGREIREDRKNKELAKRAGYARSYRERQKEFKRQIGFVVIVIVGIFYALAKCSGPI